MLFNSYHFIFFFLPVAVLGAYLCGYLRAANIRFLWLVLASLFFYSYWNSDYLALLLGSILANFYFAKWLRATSNRKVLAVAVSANVLLLVFYKYTDFLIVSVNELGKFNIGVTNIILPLAISFFTFQQIAYLVDTYRGRVAEHKLLEYFLFVSFFPQLIAGPIVHHSEMMPQFQRRSLPDIYDVQTGVCLFIIGLAKKVLLADNLALIATPMFIAADQGQTISTAAAWGGTLAYTFQIYFDFSGYTDMALGLACLFGIRLPINFNSPYKAGSIIEFWRRWHITLSRFLKDYVYIALGGNRHGKLMRYRNLMLTMLIGGLWHGAGWNFLLWGALHGLYLVCNHAWRRVVSEHLNFLNRLPAYQLMALLLTFAAVVVAWVFFRAESLAGAQQILVAMTAFSSQTGGASFSLSAQELTLNQLITVFHLPLADAQQIGLILTVSALIVFFAPNSQQLVERHFVRLSNTGNVAQQVKLTLRVSVTLALAVLLITSVSGLSGVSEFIYFQF